MDYRIYHFEWKEWLLYGIQGSLLVASVAWLFFDSFWVSIPGLGFLFFFYKWKKEDLTQKRCNELKLQFREGIKSMAAQLQAGFSAEHALKEAALDLQRMEWKESYMVRELQEMYQKTTASQTIEQVFLDFAERSGIEDARMFAEIFSVAKRSGQNLTVVIGNTLRTIGEKLETEQEIETILASRKYEQMVMSIMPFGMLFYLRLSAGSFLNVLYEGVFGRLLMSGCLLAYVVVYRLGRNVIRIEV